MAEGQPEAPIAEPPRMSDEEIFAFARDWTLEKIWIAQGEPDIESFEVYLAFIALSREFLSKTALVYEYLNQAGPRAMNGRPMFLSAKFVHIDDIPKILPVVNAMRAPLGLGPIEFISSDAEEESHVEPE